VFRGSGWRDGAGEGRTAAAHGAVATASNRACGKAGKMGENRLARLLTPRWTSGGDSWQQKSSEAVAAMVIEAWQRRRRWLGLRDKRLRLRVLRILGHGVAVLWGRRGCLCVWARGVARRARPCRAVAGLRLEPSLARGRGQPQQAGPACQRAREGERGGGVGWAGWAGGAEKRSRLVWAVQEKGKERRKAGWDWAAWKKRREEKERVGRAQREKVEKRKLHSNAFEFEFEI
jgi:hypothetical protein